MRNPQTVFSIAFALLLTLSISFTAWAAQTCSTIPNALGFDSKQSLDKFVALAKAAKNDPSKGGQMKALLEDLSSKNKAFELHGNDNVEIMEQEDPSDDELGKVKVKSRIDNKVFWVPSGALDCN